MARSLVAVVMGSASDRETMSGATAMLQALDIPFEERVISAHRQPAAVADFAQHARDRGIEVIIAGAGKAAHLAGVIASWTTVPVIGVPMATADLDGLDSLLSMVQMPTGVPVATVAIDGAKNAAILAGQILALKHPAIDERLRQYKQELAQGQRAAETGAVRREDVPLIDG